MAGSVQQGLESSHLTLTICSFISDLKRCQWEEVVSENNVQRAIRVIPVLDEKDESSSESLSLSLLNVQGVRITNCNEVSHLQKTNVQ